MNTESIPLQTDDEYEQREERFRAIQKELHAAAIEWKEGIEENKDYPYHNPHARIADLMAMDGYYRAKVAEINARQLLKLNPKKDE